MGVLTGPGPGKYRLDALVYVYDGDVKDYVLLEDAEVFIHVRGYSRAPENHLDIEHLRANKYVSVSCRGKAGVYAVTDDVDGYEYVEVDCCGTVFILYFRHDQYVLVSKLFTGDIEGDAVVPCGGKKGGLWVEFPRSEYVDQLIYEYTGIKPR